jgi:hypothetical protein
VIRPGTVRRIAQVLPAQTTTLSWSICARTAGSYVLLADATLDGATVDSPARIVTVLASDKPSPCGVGRGSDKQPA